MSLPRFFLEQQILAHEQEDAFLLDLSPDDLSHMKVLRLRAGEHIAVIDADADYFECEIVDYEDRVPVVRICRHVESPSKESVNVVLAQGLAKSDKLETVIRHATELGVSAFVPFSCERSIVKLDDKKAKNRLARWNSIAKSAAMQSGQPRIPEVLPIAQAKTLPTLFADACAVLVCWEEAELSCTMSAALRKVKQLDSFKPGATIAVVVGPEGGLSEREVCMIEESCPQAMRVSLGASILRTETSGIVAPALVLYELGELGGEPLSETAAREAGE